MLRCLQAHTWQPLLFHSTDILCLSHFIFTLRKKPCFNIQGKAVLSYKWVCDQIMLFLCAAPSHWGNSVKYLQLWYLQFLSYGSILFSVTSAWASLWHNVCENTQCLHGNSLVTGNFWSMAHQELLFMVWDSWEMWKRLSRVSVFMFQGRGPSGLALPCALLFRSPFAKWQLSLTMAIPPAPRSHAQQPLPDCQYLPCFITLL